MKNYDRARSNYRKSRKSIVVLQGFVRMVISKKVAFDKKLKSDIEKSHIYRSKIVEEIYSTEVNYVKGLETLVRVIFFFLDSYNSKNNNNKISFIMHL